MGMLLSFFWNTFSFSNTGLWKFFGRTFLNYFVTGPIILDNWMNFPGVKPDWTLFTVFINTEHVLLGISNMINPIQLVSLPFVSVIPDIASNVGTSLGTYFLIGGYPFTYFMTILFGIVVYYTYFAAYTQKKVIVIFLTCFFLTLLTLSFFVQYFTLLSTYEFPVFFIGLILIFNFYLKLKEIS